MAKKKSDKQKHQKDISLADSSEEELKDTSYQSKICPHVSRGLNFGRIKKSLKAVDSLLDCNGCANTSTQTNEIPEIWLCLQCGYRGCGRMSENRHGLQHYKTLHSDCHSLVLSSTSGTVWCYDCDDEVQLQSSRNLKQCVQFILKLKSNDAMKAPTKSYSKPSDVEQSFKKCIVEEERIVQNCVDTSKTEELKKGPKLNKKDMSVQKMQIKGLRNLGNTCFFNAVMQNLSQTYLFYKALETSCSPGYQWEVPKLIVSDSGVIEDIQAGSLQVSLPNQLPLSKSLLSFLHLMHAPSTSSKVEIVNPTNLFTEMSSKYPQLRHFQQQDSHELLRQLLDGVRQEEIKRQKRSILRHFKLESVSPENVEEEMKKIIKAYGSYASHTIVEKVFGGLLISTVLCEECKMSSQVFEPFMDLSLPLFEEKPMRNRKADVSCDEDVSGEYAYEKSKNDASKPSKYQERKMKQLAKKEKKKTKNGRNRKGLQNKSSEKPGDLPLSNDNISEDEEDEIDSNVSEAQSLTKVDEACENEVNQESAAVKEVTNPEQNMELMECKRLDETKLMNKTQLELSANDNNEQQVMDCDKRNVEQVKLLKDFQIDVLDDVISEGSEESCSKVDVNGESSKTEFSKESFKVLHSDEDASEVKHNDADATSSVSFLQSHKSVSELSEKFSNRLSMSNSSNLDSRMQELSMQVKDVRIRKDSDRQENILNSEDSGNQNSFLSESSDESCSQKTNCVASRSVENGCNSGCNANWSHSLSEKQTKEWIMKSLTTLKPRTHVSPLECSINSCLSHFTKPELLTGSNKFRCENCTDMKCKKSGNKKDVVYSNATKQLLIFSPPAILTLHLKRFTQMGMGLRKVNTFVEFPLTLDLAPFCCSASSILPHMSSVKDKILYSLYGVVEHSGRLTSGHYTAYAKVCRRTLNQNFMSHWPLAQCDLEQLLHKFGRNSHSSQKSDGANSSETSSSSESCHWYYISDSHVKEVSEAQVLKCQAYLLFYERIK